MSAELDAVFREMDAIRRQNPSHPILTALEAYLPDEDDKLFDSILDSAIQDPGCTSLLKLSPISLHVSVFGVRMLVMIAFQASKERCVQNAPDDDDWKARFLKYADVDLQTANQMGRKVRLDVQRWDATKNQIMSDLLKQSISKDDEAKASLMQAPDEITEDVLPDPYWGFPGNNVGLILTKLKTEFATETPLPAEDSRDEEEHNKPKPTKRKR
jgi:predicted NAD-dependent protein-ADP-ribosyltransferase YbiA (DUF1768 family)